MRQAFAVPGRLPGLNEYTSACRTNAHAGAKMKRAAQDSVLWAIRAARIEPMAGKVDVHVTWVEKNMRRDKDNIRHGIKYILDGLVEAGIIKDDSWTYIGELSDSYLVNKREPRVIVELEEA